MTEREFARMQVIAATGVGVITNQGAYPDPKGEGKAYHRQLGIFDDSLIPQFRRVADLIHDHGAVAIQQLLHAGRYGGVDLDYCKQASNTPQTLRHFQPPRAMSGEEIEQCIQDHAEATRRAIEAGFDGVEVTAFMGYLLANFLSPFTNQRTDEYGGSFEKRGRFMCELIAAMKGVLGDKPLIIRLNGLELLDELGGNTPEDCLRYMLIAEEAGVDCVSIVIGWHESRTGALGRDIHSDGWLYVAEEAKKLLNIPIAFGPRFGDPLAANQALGEGKFDLWEVCRPMLADPSLLHKVGEDCLPEIKPCLGGLNCLARMFSGLPYTCTANPLLGHEADPGYQPLPIVREKKVMVIGGGPAGLECAVQAAQRGHEVTVFERTNRLGGQLIYAAEEPSGGNAFMQLVQYYQAVLARLGVQVEMETEVTTKLIRQLEPDVAVVATGAGLAPTTLAMSADATLLSAYDILTGKAKFGEKVVVIGGERLGLAAAEYMARQGSQVTILEPGRIGCDVAATFKWRHVAWLEEFGIVVLKIIPTKIREDGVIYSADDGGIKGLRADSVVLGGPRQSCNKLAAVLEYVVDESYVVGDAICPRSLPQAIREGYLLGIRI